MERDCYERVAAPTRTLADILRGRPSTCSSTAARTLSTLPPRKAEALSLHAELAKTSTTGAEAPFGIRCYHIFPQVEASQSRTLQQGTEQYLSLRRSPVRKRSARGSWNGPKVRHSTCLMIMRVTKIWMLSRFTKTMNIRDDDD
jgi:hypothetical protein